MFFTYQIATTIAAIVYKPAKNSTFISTNKSINTLPRLNNFETEAGKLERKQKESREKQFAQISDNKCKFHTLKVREPTLILFFMSSSLSQRSAFLPLAMLPDELSWTLREEEHLLEQLLSIMVFSAPADFCDFACPDDNSWKKNSQRIIPQ